MIIKGIIEEDFINYKKPCMTIEFPYCSFKCDKECGQPVCQNSELATAPNIKIDTLNILKRYVNNPITEAICFQGLEPFDSWEDVYHLISGLRKMGNNDDIVIYTGYTEEEINNNKDIINNLKLFKNIIVKFGRYIPNRQSHYDEILGVDLASDNQYAKTIS